MYTVEKSIVINAPVATVWEAIVNPVLVKKYFFGTNVHSEWKKGSPIRWTGEWEGKQYEDKGTILEIEKNKLLKYNYRSSFSPKPDTPENYHDVTYKLKDLGGKTEYTVIQEGAETKEAKEHSESNWGNVLSDMKRMLEAG